MPIIRRLAFAICAIALSGCLRPSVELVLTLPKTKWEEGEFLWYKLTVKNVGWRAVEINDPFWFFQHRILENQRSETGTYLVVTDEKAGVVPPRPNPFGVHGEQRFWSNDCGNGVLCDKTGFLPVMLKRGQTLVATPSIEVPIRTGPGERALDGLPDLRAFPGDKGKATRAQLEGWRKSVTGLFQYGDPRRFVDVTQAERDRPLGYRVLDTQIAPGPGRYRIKAVMNLLRGLAPLTPEEEMAGPGWCKDARPEVCQLLAKKVREDWAKKTPNQLTELRRMRDESIRENRYLVYVESSAIEFEVIPASRPGPASGLGANPKLRAPPVTENAAMRVVEGR